MHASSKQYKLCHCSKCPGDSEYFCASCPIDLCIQCKENHVANLKTIDHNVVSYHDKLNSIQKRGTHPGIINGQICEVLDCYHCMQNSKYTILYIRNKTEQKTQRKVMHKIRSETLLHRHVLLTRIKADVQTCHSEFSFYHSEMLQKAHRLKRRLDYVLHYVDNKHRCFKQKKEMHGHLGSLQKYENIYEQSAIRPLQFLIMSKKPASLPQIQLTLHTSQLYMTESLNKEGVIQSLIGIQITERGNRNLGTESLMKLMSAPELHQSLTVTGVAACGHISCLTPDKIWSSDTEGNLLLSNISSYTIHRMKDFYSDLFSGGLHTVNSESELIYIDKNDNVKKLSDDMKTTTTLIETVSFKWAPRCVYWSSLFEGLLIGMYKNNPEAGKVARYNQNWQLTQTIEVSNGGLELYKKPDYITENNNGDILVSDSWSAVVVTNSGGKHRFSYRGHPPGSGISPQGICTDVLSHILVCDDKNDTVQMLDKDGQFLSHLLIKPQGIFRPHSLSYDVNTHRLWVGAWRNNTVCVYRYMTRHDGLTDHNTDTTEGVESHDGIQNMKTEKPQEENECLLKLVSPPKLLHSFNVTGVFGCFHISCVTPDQVWVSDSWSRLILSNIKSDNLHRMAELYQDKISGGLHTLNNECELIYIAKNSNINKVSKDMESNTTFIETTDSIWRPQCVYWSPFTEDLLVGMYRKHTEYTGTGKVTRFNKDREITQTIERDSTGLEIYRYPNYITENNNGDVVVSDFTGAVVVTERGGVHRFSYSGPTPESKLMPLGICTDPLSHILVCAQVNIHMIDKDGQFLLHLPLTSESKNKEIDDTYSLSYDVNTHCLWVGSQSNNTVRVYDYITKRNGKEVKHPQCPDDDEFVGASPS